MQSAAALSRPQGPFMPYQGRIQRGCWSSGGPAGRGPTSTWFSSGHSMLSVSEWSRWHVDPDINPQNGICHAALPYKLTGCCMTRVSQRTIRFCVQRRLLTSRH